MRFYRHFSLFTIISIFLFGCQNKPGISAQVLSDKDKAILSTFELEPGFKIELLADEPLISDPVDMEIDENGLLYVVEMHGYPLDESGSGKIKILSDTNGDGRMDKSVVFAEGLVLPNSIMRWKKGVIVTDAPNVLYFEDTNGDGRADIKDTLLTGFALSNPQHNLNNPVLAIDNWIYLGHEGAVGTQTYQKEFGDEGAEIYYPNHPDTPRLPKNASGRAVRFRPDQHLLETTSSITQFGHSFDAWGHHLLVSNANHAYHEVIGAQYLKRNPDLLVSNATQSLSDHEDAAEVFPITRNPENQLLTDIGVITSACGITDYLGGIFPAPFDSVTFVAEPVSNLVHVDRIKENGASFIASRIHPDKEFLASTDSWFRPVNMYIGPDGALYVVDYYRQIIEHPEWMGEEVVKSGKLYNGSDKGRIFRISPTNAQAATWTKNLALGKVGNDELVKELSNPNIWYRLNAQRLLIDHADKNSVPALIEMAQNQSSPLGRLHALWTLQGMNELKAVIIAAALKDPVAGVRENAIRLAEISSLNDPKIQDALYTLKNDPNPKVRYQLLCTLGSINTPAANSARNQLLFADIKDEWVQVAALSATGSTGSLLTMVIDSFQSNEPAYAKLVKKLSTMTGSGGSPQSIHELIVKAISDSSGRGWQGPLLSGIAQGLVAKKNPGISGADQQLLIQTLFSSPNPELREGCLALLQTHGVKKEGFYKNAIAKAASIAADTTQQTSLRAEAIQFLAIGNPAPFASLLRKLIAPGEPSSVQLAAGAALSSIPGTAVSEYLLSKWPVLTPEIRDAALNTFMDDNARIAILLKALETGKIKPSDVGWSRSVQLMAQQDLKMRAKARELLTKNETDQVKVNKEYQTALTLKENATRGKNIYMKNCAVCHQIRGKLGVAFGPDLGTIHNWSPDAIMANILAPNLSISSGFDLWNVELKNGPPFQGIIATETPIAITFKDAGRKEKTIKRSDIKSLKALNMSSMTSGLEKQINHQEMADLIGYLKQNK